MNTIPRKKIKKIHFIINPAAGKVEPILPVINTVLAEAGVKWEVFITQKPHDAAAMAKEAIAAEVDAVGVYGGDGTVMEAISGMIGSETPLVILPGGSANVLVAELKIPKELKEACQLICGESQISVVDVGKFNAHYFILRLGLGFEAEMVKGADRQSKNRFGRFAYVLSSWEAFKIIKEVKYHLTIDGKDYESRGVTCIIANSGSTGFSDLSFDNKIDISDGLLDVLIVRKVDITLLGHIIAAIFHKERSENLKLVHHWQGKDIQISSTPKQTGQRDGEILDKGPLHAKIIPAAVRIIVPKDPDKVPNKNSHGPT